jgi:hypothetical protein
LFFDVIDFVVSSDNSVTGANFAAYDGRNPLIALPATGQKTSYGTGDDAAQNKGVAHTSFHRQSGWHGH